MVTSIDCIFCRIVRGDLPCTKIYEDKDTLAFLSIQPVNKGHVLVIPKMHFKNMLDLPDAEMVGLMHAIKKIAMPVMQALSAHGMNVSINNEPAAGQEVMHTHFHLIPRYAHDTFENWPHTKYDEGEMEEVGRKIRDAMHH